MDARILELAAKLDEFHPKITSCHVVVDEIDRRGEIEGYHLLPVARAELLRRLGRHVEAAESYRRALVLVSNEAERRHLEKRLREIVP